MTSKQLIAIVLVPLLLGGLASVAGAELPVVATDSQSIDPGGDRLIGEAVFNIDASTNGPINCSQSSTLTFSFTPDMVTPAVRGFSLRIPRIPELSFDESSFTVNGDLWPDAPDDAPSFFDVSISADSSSYVVDYSILGTTVGLLDAVNLFTLAADGAATGAGTVLIDSCVVRDLNNQPIAAIYSDEETILVDCTAPDLPVMDSEPAFTQGLANTVSWSDESGSGAVLYYAEYDTDAGFSPPDGNSGWIAGTSHEFSGLVDATLYYYRVKTKDALDNESDWSAPESSTQDDTAPSSSVDPLPTFENSLTFDVAWTGSDATSGVASVNLWYDNGGGWVDYGNTAANPISFTAPSDGSYGFYTVAVDGVGNVEPAAGAADANTIVDSTAPSGTFVINNAATATNSLSVTLNNDISDANAITMAFSNDDVTYSSPVAYAATYAWDLAAGADGTRTVYAQFTDEAGHLYAISDDILYDTEAPGAASGIDATPGHEKVTLNWVSPGDGDLAGFEIWRGLWHDGTQASAYPEYGSEAGNVEPTRPLDRSDADASVEWTHIHTTLATETSYEDSWAPRGIYYYELFPVDAAGNFGPTAAANDRATNYWLGDVKDDTNEPPGFYDGLVDFGDISELGASYGVIDGGVDYNNECDVGPTTTALGDGIPLPDDIVGFEDLMIFAQNYGNVAPRPVIQGSDIALLSWFQREDGAWSLALTEPCANLKALRLRASLPAGATASISGGSMLAQQAGPVFLEQIPGQGLDVSLALMGRDLVLSGQGVLFTVILPAGLLPGAVELAVRDASNQSLDFALSATEVEELPTSYRLAGNFPNPFNPKTSIAFDLPESQFVRLAVFGADGRRVRTLVDRQLAAGRQVVSWDGCDGSGLPVASGVYFYRIEAGPLRETHKMLLMK